jgi:hypothetical protein
MSIQQLTSIDPVAIAEVLVGTPLGEDHGNLVLDKRMLARFAPTRN